MSRRKPSSSSDKRSKKRKETEKKETFKKRESAPISGRHKSKHKHIPESLRNYLVGIIDMKSSGKAYLLPENKEVEDIFIAANDTQHSLDGDKVRVLLFPTRAGRRLEGQVVEIIKRNKSYIVGVVEIEKKYAFVIPDNTSIPVDIYIPLLNLNKAKDGDKVLVEIEEWPQHMNNPVGIIRNVLGTPGENDVEMNSILAEYNFPLEYDAEALKEAEGIDENISKAEISKRRDFRNTTTCTIDPFDAKDFDDALSFRTLPNGNYEIGVHIADVSHFVKPGSPIDIEAYNRATSVYLVDRTIAMLPERLCNDLCSLKPNVDRLSYSVVLEMDKNAKVLNTWIGKGIINSDRRLTYEEAQEMIEGTYIEKNTRTKDNKSNDRSTINIVLELHALASILREERFKKGSINFHSQEVRFNLEEKTAKPIGVYIKESKESNFLVEEFMLLANKKVAESVGKASKPKTFVYRIHDEPNPEKLSNFIEFVSKFGYKVDNKSRSYLIKSFNRLLEDVNGKAEQNMIETIAIRTMSKAYYSTDNIGHYGLSFSHYSHFTSPIRRYPDLMVHRLLERYENGDGSVNKGEYEEYCEHCSVMEKTAANAERASIKYKQAEYLSDKVGEYFYGLVSGVSKWGIYVSLEENYCEGMVALRSLLDDIYELDEENYMVVGLRNGNAYRLGDKVKIRVKAVDLNKKQMDFIFV